MSRRYRGGEVEIGRRPLGDENELETSDKVTFAVGFGVGDHGLPLFLAGA